ncbi:uncharacterized protein E0L32_011440 [Thyridium curvatum]|uniref:Protein N-terminal and lysine N-methyltransferase EFM7 n=1 Tax=Thyridium curvatum TaxID=1093900 RepID=A0A507BPY2_9PEZI|nr:uncharacterized protein E0L32_011440 [Thyridium curvatum]TPX18888.1 hypothetical protein E0L32_011440 [Thyridium curvatum]
MPAEQDPARDPATAAAAAEDVVVVEEDPSTGDLFADPEDYYPPTPPPKQESYTLRSGERVTLHLVGSSPLEAHHLWNGSRVLADYFEADPAGTVRGRTVLELGAGAGLPSLVAAVLGARKVVVTDFPDPELVATMWKNVDGVEDLVLAGQKQKQQQQQQQGTGGGDGDRRQTALVADGHVWGADPAPLLAHLDDDDDDGLSPAPLPVRKFDVLILADLLFRHSEHGNMLRSVRTTMRRRAESAAYVFFTSYRPWLREKDLRFFELAREQGFLVDQVLERRMDRPLFENDPGDEEVLKTVTGWRLRWPEGEWDES